MQMHSQDKWKLESSKEGDAQVNNMNKKTYYCCTHHDMWKLHNPGGFELSNSNKENTK